MQAGRSFFFRYSSGAIGAMTGIADEEFGAFSALSGLAAGASGIDPAPSPNSPERGSGGFAAGLFVGDVSP